MENDSNDWNLAYPLIITIVIEMCLGVCFGVGAGAKATTAGEASKFPLYSNT